MRITMGSLFSGIGGFEIAANWYGIDVLWQSEIDPWAVELLKKRFSNAIQLGDVKKINGAEIPPVDIITFGSPCQDMSVAGARKGMKYICPECGAEFDIQSDTKNCPECGKEVQKTRSGLFTEAVRIIREMRRVTNGEYPKYIIWENVPGALTSNKGHDFRTVLEKITETEIPIPKSGRWANAGMVRGGKCDVSWRILDAQYWGVPQRRKRIYLVGDYRAGCSAEVLFKPEGVSRHTEPSRETRKRLATHIKENVGETSGILKAAGFCPEPSERSRNIGYEEGISPTLRAGAVPAVIVIQDKIIGRKDRNTGNGNGISEDVCYTLTGTDVHGVCAPVVFDARGNGRGDISPTITGDHNSRITDYTAILCEPAIAFQGQASDNAEEYITYIVRRLTPSECAKLQTFPAYWHKGVINSKGKEMPDTAAYKGYGNAVATVCAEYPIANIAAILRESKGEKTHE